MSPTVAGLRLPDGGFPRVSGDEPADDQGKGTIAEFSPREWG